MADGKFRKNRFSTLETMAEIFPGLDIGPLVRIRDLYKDLSKLDALYRAPKEVLRVWRSSLTFLEEVILHYINKFPSLG